MPFWRREEPLHERLAREGGLGEPPPLDPRPAFEVGIHGVHRPREWDAVVAAEAPELEGEHVQFVALEDSLVVDGEQDVGALAEAVESVLAPPYRAVAVNRGEGRWAVGARAIRVAELQDAPGNELELTVREGQRALRADGKPAFGGVPALERLAEGDVVIRATRIDGDFFEVRIDPL